ncbi:acyltransferase [Microvirga terrae]|uniref:Acyltransferase n=1 Tax=Microvirga terrae TaxID=2740529 RepID=A0ABY5RMB3_9HYPH|nr:acyltransferase [Microvirga terrae]UVF18356.1 acyltransferase [Microvirga terrae]
MRHNTSLYQSEPSQDAAQDRLYLPALDGLRFFAFLAVVFNHIDPTPSLPFLYTLYSRGWVGVELFFVLSAYLIFALFRIEYLKNGRIAVVDFFIRRLLRLYPLMIAAPLLFMLMKFPDFKVDAALTELRNIALFTNNLFWFGPLPRAIPFASHLWTLSFEFQVYLFLPSAFLVYAALGHRRFFGVLAAVSIVCLAFRSWYALSGVHYAYIYFSPVLRPDSILIGIALALLASHVRGHALLAAIALVVSAMAFFALPNLNVPGPTAVALYPAAAVMCGSILWLSLNLQWARRLLSSKAFVYLGKRSYGLYVFHVSAIALTKTYVLPSLSGVLEGPAQMFFTTLLASLGFTVGMAAASYRFFEKPFLRMKDKRAIILSRPF